MESLELKSAIEAILLAADRPVTILRFMEVFEEDKPLKEDVRDAIEALKDKYADDEQGFGLREAQGGYQFCTKVKNGEYVRKFLASRPFRLSPSALETLAIIAYRQPITRAEIDKIRGMDCSHLMRTLIEKGIVKMAGKADIPGRPVQYGTTPKFLELVGLNSTAELPPLSELKELQGDTPQKDPLEEGLQKFIDSDAVLDERAHELEQGLGEITEMIKSSKDPKREVYESPEHKDSSEANEEAAVGFQVFSRKWKKKAPQSVDGPEAVTTEESLAAQTEPPPEKIEPEPSGSAPLN